MEGIRQGDIPEIPPPPIEAVQNPRAAIMQTMQEVSAMGRNDHELSTLTDILRRLTDPDPTKRLSPEDAVMQAYAIRYKKQDYN